MGWLVGLLEGNQFAAGGLVAVLASGCLLTLRSLAGWLWERAKQDLLVSVEVVSQRSGGAFQAILEELGEKRRLVGSWRVRGTEAGTLEMSVGNGVTWRWPLKVYRYRLDKVTDSLAEAIEVTTLRPWAGHVEALLEGVRRRLEDGSAGSVQVLASEGSYWSDPFRRPRRPLSTYRDPTGEVTALLGRARAFLSEPPGGGHPWRMGALLHGPPGTGKSTAAHVLATELGIPIYSLAAGHLACISSLASQVKPNSMLLIEDADLAVPADRDDEARKALLGNLLNSLDGLLAPSRVLVVMTTNRPEALDPALVRLGRVDVRIRLGVATDDAGGNR